MRPQVSQPGPPVRPHVPAAAGPSHPCSPAKGTWVVAAQSLRRGILSPARCDWPRGAQALPPSPG